MKSNTRYFTALVIFIFSLALNASAQTVPITITSYEIKSTPRSGFGCWFHNYTGTIIDTGRTVSGSVVCFPGGGTGSSIGIADYANGSGTLNDNVISSIGNTHLFLTGRLDDTGNPILPEITLHLGSTFIINDILLFGGDPSNAIPGALTDATVEIGGVAVALHIIPFGDLNPIGVPVNGKLVLTGTPLAGPPTNQIVLKNFVSLFFDQFSITEIQVDGSLPPVVKYVVSDLGTLGFHSEATGINSAGQVVGHTGLGHAFRTAPNAAINPATDDLGTLGGLISQATGINDAGQVVGVSFTADGAYHAFRTAPNASINPPTDDLGTLGGGTSWAYGINASGQVVGTSIDAGGDTRAFRTAPGAAISPATDDLGSLVSSPSQAAAYGINTTGQVVGASYAGRGTHAFRTAPNAAINSGTDDLGTLGGAESIAFGINASGQVVGRSDISFGLFGSHAFRTARNAAIDPATDDLGTLGGLSSIAFGINASGQVVGSSQIASGESHAFVYSNGAMQDLNNRLLVDSGWIFQEADGINDGGQIVGSGLHNGATRAFRATPVVPFSAFNAAPEIGSDRFELNGRFTLGEGSNGINPHTEAVTLQLGTFSVTMPQASFKKASDGRYVFEGTIDGAALELRIAPVTTNSYTFNAEGSGANLSGTVNPVSVVLTIGDDGGATTARAK